MKNNDNEEKLTSHGQQIALKTMLFIAGEVFLLLFLIMMTRLTDTSIDVKFWFHHVESELVVYGTIIIILVITGLFSSFLRAFVFCVRKTNEIPEISIKKSLLAVKISMVSAVVSQLFVLAYGCVSMMLSVWSADGALEEMLPVCLAAYAGGSVYGILVIVVLLPVYARLKIRLIEMQKE